MKLSIFLLVITLFLSAFASVLLHSLPLLPSKPVLRWSFGIVYVLLFLSIFVGILLEHKLGLGLTKMVTFTGYTFLIVVMMMLASYILVDIVRLANRFIHFAPANMLVIRQWVAGISLVLIVVVLIIGNYRFNHPAVVKLDLRSSKPLQNKEVRIVAASDIHLGSSIDKKRLHQFVRFINAQNPDIILLAGDITDRSFGPVLEQKMEEELRQLKAPMGVFAISGNHEHYSGEHEEITKYLLQAGITLLQDTSTLINDSFYLIGRRDFSDSNRKKLVAMTAGLRTELPKILLDHQPHHLDEAVQQDIDLQISGHTHNGQVFPGNLIVRNMYENGYGYLKKNDTHFYVSSGLGIWGPQYRIGTQSEVVVIRFRY